jgi:CRISPR/Cas system endoribonuclease Cas6 (RAMP superfamily)
MGWRFDVLHAIACSVFERPGDTHDAGDKAFSVRAGHRTITLAWLDTAAPQKILLPDEVLVGDERIRAAGVRETVRRYEAIEAHATVPELDFAVSTPTLFRHNGHNYPLPDPYVAFAGLARRYRTYRPNADMGSEVVKELGRSVMVVRHRLKTEQFSWHGRTDSGFVGTFTFRLGPQASPHARKAFTTLGTFAAIAGLGRGTTHGLGATSVTTPRRARSRA